MVKKIRKLFVLAFCMTFLFGMTVRAEGNTEFHVENQTGKAGDIVTVPVQFNTGQEVGGFQISVYYDNDVMEYQSLEPGNLINDNIEEGGLFDYNHIEESSEIIVVYVVADTVKDEGVIVNIDFKLKQDCGEDLPIGMGVDDLVDGSDENNALTGTVSGVDTAFQEKVMEQRADDTATVVASGNSADDTSAGSSDGQEAGDGAADASDSENTTGIEDGNNKAGQEGKTGADAEISGETDAENDATTDGKSIVPIIIGVIVVVVIAAVVIIVVLKKKSRHGRRRGRKK